MDRLDSYSDEELLMIEEGDLQDPVNINGVLPIQKNTIDVEADKIVIITPVEISLPNIEIPLPISDNI